MKKIVCVFLTLGIITSLFSCKKEKDAPVIYSSPRFKYKVNGTWHTSVFSAAQIGSYGTLIYGADHASGTEAVPPAMTLQLPVISGPGSFSLDTVFSFWTPDNTNVYFSYTGVINITRLDTKIAGNFYFDAIGYNSTFTSFDTLHITQGTFSNIPIYKY
jgi:hypothetical protein